MLGNFSVAQNGTSSNPSLLSELTGRSKRIWIIIAYLIVNRERGVSATELIDRFWPDTNAANPQTRIQNSISRARAAFDNGEFSNARDLIRYENGLYWWAPGRQTVLDVDVFEQAVRNTETINEETIDQALQICDLYQGDFLFQAAEEAWCTSLNIYYRSLFTNYASKVLAALKRANRKTDIKRLCLKVVGIDPTIEEFNIALMEALIADETPEKAIEHYEHIKTIFNEVYGVQVSPEIEVQRNLALEAMYGSNVSQPAILEYFSNPSQDEGAFRCNAVTFREIVHLHKRMYQRSGETSQLLAMEFKHAVFGKTEADKNIANAKRLEKVIQQTLRSGDPFTKIGRDIFMCLLPGATEENAEMITRRIIDEFHKEFPFCKVSFKTWHVGIDEL